MGVSLLPLFLSRFLTANAGIAKVSQSSDWSVLSSADENLEEMT